MPLERWLLDRSASARQEMSISAEHGASADLLATQLPRIESTATQPDQERLQELELALAAALREKEEMRQQALKREEELRAELGGELSTQLIRVTREGLAGLQNAIEEAISILLMPLLRDRLHAIALIDLRKLIALTMANSQEPLLQVKAPAHLHDTLRELVEGCGLSATMSESESVELVFGHHRARFEELSRRWIEGLEDHDA